jgi:hypothetical protein
MVLKLNLFNIFLGQTINQIQSEIHAIKKKTFHSTMGNAPNHTLHTNENRQHFPNLNILKYFFNSCARIDNIFQNKIYCLDTSISFLFNIPFRKCHSLVVVLVTKYPLFCWHVGSWWISNITFQYADNVIIHHPVIQTIITSDRRSESLSLNIDQICVCEYVSESVPLQITLGVLVIIVEVSWLLGYLEKNGQFHTTPGVFPYFMCS